MGQEMLEDPEEGPEKGKEPPPLDAQDIAILKHYGKGLYFDAVKQLETDCKDLVKQVRPPLSPPRCLQHRAPLLPQPTAPRAGRGRGGASAGTPRPPAPRVRPSAPAPPPFQPLPLPSLRGPPQS